MFFLSINRIWNGRKFLHTSWSLRPEAQDTIHQPPRDAKNTQNRASLSFTHRNTHTTHSCVLMNAPDLFCRNWGHLLLATPPSLPLFLALIKLPAAPVTNTLLISRLLLAKTDFRLYKKKKKPLTQSKRQWGARAEPI